MPFLNVSTIANIIGSCHLFIPSEGCLRFWKQCKSKGESDPVIGVKIGLYCDWIYNEYDMMGSEIRIATKNG